MAKEKFDFENDRLIDVFEAARLLGLSRWTLEVMKSRKILPCYRLGRRVLFSTKDLAEWVALNRVEKNQDRR